MYNFKVKQETFMMGLLFRSMVVKGTRDALLEKVKKSVVTPNYYPHTRPPSNPPKTKQRGTI